MWSILLEKKKIHIHYNVLYEFYNFVTPFLSHHFYTLSLFDQCLGVEKKIFKEIMQFHYMTSTRTPTPGVMKFTILVDPSVVIITTYMVCLIYAWELRRRFLKKYSNFTLFSPKLPPLWIGGPEIYNFLFPYPTNATYQIWLRLAQ